MSYGNNKSKRQPLKGGGATRADVKNPIQLKPMKLLKDAVQWFVNGWGKRQLLKLGAVVVPIIGITSEEWAAAVAVLVGVAIWLVEMAASWASKKKLEEGIRPEIIE